MKRIFVACVVVLIMGAGLAYGQDRGTPAEARALLDSAVVFYKANGPEKAFTAFNDPKGKFVNKDLYIYALDLNAKMLAHGADSKLIGKDMTKVKDAVGKLWLQEVIVVAKTRGKGSVDYKWEHPKTKKVEQKSTYLEKVDGVILCSGYYK